MFAGLTWCSRCRRPHRTSRSQGGFSGAAIFSGRCFGCRRPFSLLVLAGTSRKGRRHWTQRPSGPHGELRWVRPQASRHVTETEPHRAAPLFSFQGPPGSPGVPGTAGKPGNTGDAGLPVSVVTATRKGPPACFLTADPLLTGRHRPERRQRRAGECRSDLLHHTLRSSS